jgi:hypothetical protein
MTEIEVPVKKIVKAYFLHETNLGPDPILGARSEVGRIISAQSSFNAEYQDDLAIKVRRRNEKLTIIRLKTTFKVETDKLSMHHLYSIGDALEALFEREFWAFCVGRFSKAPAFYAAVDDFFMIYDLDKWEINKESFRRVQTRKYQQHVGKVLKKIEKSRKDRIELEKKMHWNAL